MTRLILASASPRRRDLVALLGLDFTVAPADIDETLPERPADPAAAARDLARRKAEASAAQHPAATVLAADTIVVLEGRLLEKPGSPDEAAAMLRALRGRPHQVTTAVAIARQGETITGSATTDVHMRDYSDEEIAAYIASGEPFDKAGGYAIQDPVFRPVERYDGCYCNVVGLPLATSVKLLQRAGIDVPKGGPTGLLPECLSCPLYARESAGEML